MCSATDGAQPVWADHLLRCFRRVLVVGADTADVPESGVGEKEGARVFVRPSALSPDDPPLDAVVLVGPDDWEAGLSDARPFLSVHGAAFLTVRDQPATETTLETMGMRVYVWWRANEAGDAWGVMAVSAKYDPVAHARALFAQGRPDWGLEVLENVPDAFPADAHARALLAAERQRCILAWDRAAGTEGRLERFFRAQREFYVTTTLLPRRREPYVVQAAFWHSIGNDDMAGRLLRSIDYATTGQARPPGPAERLTDPRDLDVPVWTPPATPPRLLLITHQESDYGLDTLYDGLCTVLGAENVTEFPWKPTLHGQSPEKTYGYPCLFNRSGEPLDLEEVCQRLRDGAYDVALVADTLCTLPPELVRPLMAAVGDTALFLLDTWDEGGDYRADTLRHLGRERATAYFKREMLECGDYGPHTYPLPFCYPDALVPEGIDGERPEGVFWAGKRLCGLRALYLDQLQAAFGLTFDRTYEPSEYLAALHRTRIGLNFFGLGFDTVRYWELPAHGCLLLAERPPIRIPYNFRDGESAVFFDDLPDLIEKLEHYLAHPQEVATIARAATSASGSTIPRRPGHASSSGGFRRSTAQAGTRECENEASVPSTRSTCASFPRSSVGMDRCTTPCGSRCCAGHEPGLVGGYAFPRGSVGTRRTGTRERDPPGNRSRPKTPMKSRFFTLRTQRKGQTRLRSYLAPLASVPFLLGFRHNSKRVLRNCPVNGYPSRYHERETAPACQQSLPIAPLLVYSGREEQCAPEAGGVLKTHGV